MNCSPTQAVYQATKCLTATVSKSGGSLPFTGFDIAFVVLAGLFLIVLGVSLRRITRDA